MNENIFELAGRVAAEGTTPAATKPVYKHGWSSTTLPTAADGKELDLERVKQDTSYAGANLELVRAVRRKQKFDEAQALEGAEREARNALAMEQFKKRKARVAREAAERDSRAAAANDAAFAAKWGFEK